MSLTSNLGSLVMGPAHHLTERNICVKFNENRSKGLGDMKWTRKCYRQDGQTKVIPIAPHRFMAGVQEIWSGHEIEG